MNFRAARTSSAHLFWRSRFPAFFRESSSFILVVRFTFSFKWRASRPHLRPGILQAYGGEDVRISEHGGALAVQLPGLSSLQYRPGHHLFRLAFVSGKIGGMREELCRSFAATGKGAPYRRRCRVTRRRKHSLRFGRRSLRQIKFSERLDNGGALFYNFDYRTDCVGTFGVVGSAAASPRAPLGKSGRKIRKQALTRGRNALSRGGEET